MVLAVLLLSDVILLVVVDDEVVLAVQPAVLEGLDGEPVGALVLVRGAYQEGPGVVHREGEKLLGLRAAYLAEIPPEKHQIIFVAWNVKEFLSSSKLILVNCLSNV